MRSPQLIQSNKKARQGFLAWLFCLLLAACDNSTTSADLKQLRFAGPIMGTEYHVSVILESDQTVDPELDRTIAHRLADINQSMSTYLEDSELSRLNRAPDNQWIPLSNKLFTVLSLAQIVSGDSDGAFDITVGPLVNLWGFGPGEGDRESLPAVDDIAARLQLIGYQKIQLDPEQSAVMKLDTISMDLSAIAKGFAADEVSQMLLVMGYSNHMVEIGGEVMAYGRNAQGKPWRIGIENPSFSHTGVQEAIAISGMGVATSGDYRNYFEVDGQRYSHTIDPLTGRPITHNLVSVTVIAATAAEADAYATAINVLGYSPGKALAEKRDLAVYFILRRNDQYEVHMTPKFYQYQSKG
jgi:thiamine biosynthesis lipoprotein